MELQGGNRFLSLEREIVAKGQLMAQNLAPTGPMRSSAVQTKEALVWDGSEWWLARLPGSASTKSRQDDVIRTTANHVVWTRLTPEAAMKFADQADEAISPSPIRGRFPCMSRFLMDMLDNLGVNRYRGAAALTGMALSEVDPRITFDARMAAESIKALIP